MHQSYSLLSIPAGTIKAGRLSTISVVRIFCLVFDRSQPAIEIPVQRLVFVILVFLSSGCVSLRHQTFSDHRGAIRGYDPVAYFSEQDAVPGNPLTAYDFQGSRWIFASEFNRSLFIADTGRYMPQYGGYCAYAMSKGFAVSIDPNAWSIVDDKLYLNYSLRVRKTWLKNREVYIAKADKKWDERK